MTGVLGVIGCGNMGSVLVRGVAESGLLAPRQILVWDTERTKMRRLVRALKVGAASSESDLAASSTVILLAVKPQQMAEVLCDIRPFLSNRSLLISIAAGIPTRWIERRAGRGARVVRVMPNTPALVRAGISAIAPGRSARPADGRLAERIFRCVGETVRLPERQMDAVTAVSGSGPAYFFFLMEQMEKAGIRLGLSPADARRLVIATAMGAARLASSAGEAPEMLRARVTSKGGTTEAAFKVFDRAGLSRILQVGIRVAAKRAKQLTNPSLRTPKG